MVGLGFLSKRAPVTPEGLSTWGFWKKRMIGNLHVIIQGFHLSNKREMETSVEPNEMETLFKNALAAAAEQDVKNERDE